MVLKSLIPGFLVKIITGLDDTMVHIPIVANITKTKIGRIAFSLGIFLAISAALILSFLFANAIKTIPYYRYISAALIFLLALAIYSDFFVHEPRRKATKKIKQTKEIRVIHTKRVFQLIALGFITAFATVIDDTIAFSSLFFTDYSIAIYAVIGIYIATLLELTAIIYFSKKIQKIPFKKEITTIGLIALSILILFSVL